MDERLTAERMAELQKGIDHQMRDFERLRNHAEQREHSIPYWPDRRRVSRVPGRGDDEGQ